MVGRSPLGLLSAAYTSIPLELVYVVDPSPVARSPIRPAPPIVMLTGWEVSARRSTSPLRLIDCTPYTKILVWTDPESPWAQALGLERGRAKRTITGALVAA